MALFELPPKLKTPTILNFLDIYLSDFGFYKEKMKSLSKIQI
jgi:hypothetical protein